MPETVRKHFVLPKDLAEEFERVAGERKQSECLTSIIERWLQQERSRAAFDALANAKPTGESEWHELGASEWVRRERAKWDRELPLDPPS